MNTIAHLELTRDIIADTQGVYALRVKGHSFQSALISDGDIVILRRVTDAENGDMVAVQGKVIAVIRNTEREASRPALAQASLRKGHKAAPASETLFDPRGV